MVSGLTVAYYDLRESVRIQCQKLNFTRTIKGTNADNAGIRGRVAGALTIFTERHSSSSGQSYAKVPVNRVPAEVRTPEPDFRFAN